MPNYCRERLETVNSKATISLDWLFIEIRKSINYFVPIKINLQNCSQDIHLKGKTLKLIGCSSRNKLILFKQMDTAKTSSVPPYMSQVQYMFSPLIVLYIQYTLNSCRKITEYLYISSKPSEFPKFIAECQVIVFEKLAVRYKGTTTNGLCSYTNAPVLCVHRWRSRWVWASAFLWWWCCSSAGTTAPSAASAPARTLPSASTRRNQNKTRQKKMARDWWIASETSSRFDYLSKTEP